MVVFVEGLLRLRSGCLPLSKYWLQKEGKGLWAIVEPQEAHSTFITEALDVLSGKLKKEKKTPKKSFCFFFHFQGSALWWPHFYASCKIFQLLGW